jgi:hypothetical protein
MRTNAFIGYLPDYLAWLFGVRQNAILCGDSALSVSRRFDAACGATASRARTSNQSNSPGDEKVEEL